MYNIIMYKPSMTSSQSQSQKIYECKNLLSFHMLILLSPYNIIKQKNLKGLLQFEWTNGDKACIVS